MGDCKHCGENAGFFKSVHADCAKRFTTGRVVMVGRATEAAMGKVALNPLQQELTLIADANFVPREQVRPVLAEGLSTATDILFDDGLLTTEEEESLRAYMRHSSLDQGGRPDVLARLTRGAKGGVRRQPSRCLLLPVNELAFQLPKV